MTKIKICGITNRRDAHLAVEMGADALGFIFAQSPRQISPEDALEIIRTIPPSVTRIGVFVNEKFAKLQEIIAYCHLDMVQLHGDKCLNYKATPSRTVIKAYAVRNGSVLLQIRAHGFPYFLLDTYHPGFNGGTGRTFDWNIARKANSLGHMILSGGLNPGNVGAALDCVSPYAVDICSGVEKRPGVKDHIKMQEFFDEVKNWRRTTK